MITRPFDEKDRNTLQTLYLETRKQKFNWLNCDTLTLSDFDKDTLGESIWVCESHAAVVGFIAAQTDDRFIHHLFVMPEFSGKGVGSQLLKICLTEIGFPAQLKCVTENTQALQFYHSQGWRTVAKDIGPDGEYQLMEVNQQSQNYFRPC